MRLYERLLKETNISSNNIIAITGGGGKTTLLTKFSSYLRDNGFSVLITTTTKVQNPLFYNYEADYVFKEERDVLMHEEKKGEKVFFAESLMDVKRVKSPRAEVLKLLSRRYDFLLYEADGSRGLPIKIHTERDPVILDGTTAVIAIMGLDGYNGIAYNMVFGDDRDIAVDNSYISWYLKDPEGLLKGMRDNTKNIIILNKADGRDEIFSKIKEISFPYLTLAASEEKDEIYFSI